MPRSLLSTIYLEKTKEPSSINVNVVDEPRVEPSDFMRTRSGLFIKRHQNATAVKDSLPNSKAKNITALGTSKFVSQVLQAAANKQIKEQAGSLMSLSIITRYDMLRDGTEIHSSDLNLTNEPTSFFASEQHLRNSLTGGEIKAKGGEESGLAPKGLLCSRIKSLSNPTLSSESANPPSPSLGRSTSVPAGPSFATCKTEPGQIMHNKSGANKTVKLLFENHPVIDLDQETPDSLASKLRPFCSPQQSVIANPNLYKCGLCRQVYGGLKSFGEHINTHLRLKNKCHVCGRVFTRSWLLKGHLRIHTGEKPFQCSACGKRFADKSNMRSHLLTHTVTKRAHACDRCGKTFAQRRYLRKHLLEVCSRVNQPSLSINPMLNEVSRKVA